MSNKVRGKHGSIAGVPAITDCNHLPKEKRSCIRATTLLFIAASRYRNISCLVGYFVPITSIMSVSKDWRRAFKPAMDNTFLAVLEIPQFKSVLTEADKQNSSTVKLGQLVAYAKKHMSEGQYQAIKERCPNQVCKVFFAEVADQIQENKDHATLALVAELRRTGLRIPEGDVKEIKAIRAWFNNPANSTAIQGVTELDLSAEDLKVVPDELSLFTGLQRLDLSANQLESIDVSRLTQLKVLCLGDNELESIDVSELRQLKELCIRDNPLKSVEGLSGLTQLQLLDLENTPLQENKDHATLALAAALRGGALPLPAGKVEEIRAWFNNPANSTAIQGVTELDLSAEGLKVVPDELSLFTGLQRLGLSKNQIESVEGLSGLTELQWLDLSANKLESIDVSELTQLQELWLEDNQLERVEGLSRLTQLQWLDLSYNLLESIDISGLPHLQELRRC